MKYLLILITVLFLACASDDAMTKPQNHIIGGLEGTLNTFEEIHNNVCKFTFNNNSNCSFRILGDCGFFSQADILILTECESLSLFNVRYILSTRWYVGGKMEHHYKQVEDNYNNVWNLDVCFTYPDNILIFEDEFKYADNLYLTVKK